MQTEREQLLDESPGRRSSRTKNEGSLQIILQPDRAYEPSEIIDEMGFGKAQLIAFPIVALSFLFAFSTIDLQPFLGVNLYVKLELTKYQQSLMNFLPICSSIFGVTCLGYISDKFGRRNALMLSSFLLLLFNLLTCAHQHYIWITVCRTLVGLSRGSVTVGSLYYAEILPAKYLYMGPLIGSLVAGSTLGDGLVVLVGYFLLADNAYSWQFYLIAMSTPMVLFLILALFFLEETPQFYLAKGNETKAKKILQKWAAQNGKQIPDNIKLLAPKLNQTSTFNAIHLRKIRDVYSHLHFTKNWICIVLIAGMSRSLNDGMNFTLAELLYAKGESGYYCKGSETKTYYLTKSDYTALLLAQLVSVVTFLIAYPIMRAGISAKIRALSCFALSIPLVSGLYLCPNSAVAFVLLSVVRICAQISTLAAVHALVELMIPSDVRGTIIGVSNSIRTAPLALYALLTTTLAKHSQNYVTSLTMAVLLIGLAAALVMSNDVNKNIRPKEREHASLDELVEISENSNI